MSDSLQPQTVHGILQAIILECVAFPFRGSFQPRDQTQVSRTAGGFFTSWAAREAQCKKCRCYSEWDGKPLNSSQKRHYLTSLKGTLWLLCSDWREQGQRSRDWLESYENTDTSSQWFGPGWKQRQWEFTRLWIYSESRGNKIFWYRLYRKVRIWGWFLSFTA